MPLPWKSSLHVIAHLSHLMRLWYFLSSLNSFKSACVPSSVARCLIFVRTLRLCPYFMCANSEGSGEIAQMRRLTWAFTGHLCDAYHNLMSWLILCSDTETFLFAGDFSSTFKIVSRLKISSCFILRLKLPPITVMFLYLKTSIQSIQCCLQALSFTLENVRNTLLQSGFWCSFSAILYLNLQNHISTQRRL